MAVEGRGCSADGVQDRVNGGLELRGAAFHQTATAQARSWGASRISQGSGRGSLGKCREELECRRRQPALPSRRSQLLRSAATLSLAPSPPSHFGKRALGSGANASTCAAACLRHGKSAHPSDRGQNHLHASSVACSLENPLCTRSCCLVAPPTRPLSTFAPIRHRSAAVSCRDTWTSEWQSVCFPDTSILHSLHPPYSPLKSPLYHNRLSFTDLLWLQSFHLR